MHAWVILAMMGLFCGTIIGILILTRFRNLVDAIKEVVKARNDNW